MCCGRSLRRTQHRDRACSSGFGVAFACAVCPFACTTDGKTRGRKLHWGRLHVAALADRTATKIAFESKKNVPREKNASETHVKLRIT